MPTVEHCLFHGLPAVRLQATNGASATITLHGAHVVSWTNPSGVEQLYLSPNTRYEAGQAIRGGVPVVFPQFNTRGVLPRHGFARTSNWTLLETPAPAQTCSATLALAPNKVIKSLWPHAFGCTLEVSLQDDTLRLCLTVNNTDTNALQFQAALHTYLNIGAIESVHVAGLDGADFEDNTDAARPIKPHSALRPFDAIDRIYYHAPDTLQLQSERGTMTFWQSSFQDLVVWNPGGAAAACPPDLPKDGFRQFLCVEAAQIGESVWLEPGQSWSGTQVIQASRKVALPSAGQGL